MKKLQRINGCVAYTKEDDYKRDGFNAAIDEMMKTLDNKEELC